MLMRQRQALLVSLFLLLMFLTGATHAGTVVLIHGFQGKGLDWRSQGVTPALQATGWHDAGHYAVGRHGVQLWANQQLTDRDSHVFFTVDLPSSAAIGTQAQVLDGYLHAIYRMRQEPLMLVGHSAGGIVARYWLVTRNAVPVNTLMTIATPHLGTPLADVADLLNGTPLAGMVNRAGISTLKKARHLARDLREEAPGTFLYWLNHQHHPVIRYVSVIRDSPHPDNVDFVVPPHRQDMNNVFALRGQTFSVRSGGDHFLGAEDGYRIASVALALPATPP